jgi:hypothetical protein
MFRRFFCPRGDPLDPALTRGEVVKIETKPIGASLLIDFNPPIADRFGSLLYLTLDGEKILVELWHCIKQNLMT